MSSDLPDVSSGEVDDAQDRTERRPMVPALARVFAAWSGGSRLIDVGGLHAIVIGRGAECHLRIDDISVSRRHAVLHLHPVVAIEDCGSTNGTSVNGKQIAANQLVVVGEDTPISIGSALVVLQGGRDTSAHNARGSSSDIETKMGQANKLIELLSKSLLNVLIVGETGVGKEVATDRLHALSERRGALVKINCAALPEQLLEAELFGYERGSFTGAAAAKPGLVEAADGGTLFLDEIGELPLSTQAKLLRVLEAREVQRLGALRARKVDVRFVAATNRNLSALVRAGRFRQDLYFRLNGMTLPLPPLRDRLEELPRYVKQFLDQACALVGRPAPGITDGAMQLLAGHRWPGNLRELRNVVDRALMLAGTGSIDRSHIMLGLEETVDADEEDEPPPPSSRSMFDTTRQTGQWHFVTRAPSAPPSVPSPAPPPTVELGERERIIAALSAAAGNQTEAAKLLGISRRTLVYKLGHFGLPRPRK